MLIGAGFFSAQVKYVKWKEVCTFAGRIFGRCENCQKDTPEYSEKKEKEHERQDFWGASASRAQLHASDCGASGCWPPAGDWKFLYQ